MDSLWNLNPSGGDRWIPLCLQLLHFLDGAFGHIISNVCSSIMVCIAWIENTRPVQKGEKNLLFHHLILSGYQWRLIRYKHVHTWVRMHVASQVVPLLHHFHSAPQGKQTASWIDQRHWKKEMDVIKCSCVGLDVLEFGKERFFWQDPKPTSKIGTK